MTEIEPKELPKGMTQRECVLLHYVRSSILKSEAACHSLVDLLKEQENVDSTLAEIVTDYLHEAMSEIDDYEEFIKAGII